MSKIKYVITLIIGIQVCLAVLSLISYIFINISLVYKLLYYQELLNEFNFCLERFTTNNTADFLTTRNKIISLRDSMLYLNNWFKENRDVLFTDLHVVVCDDLSDHVQILNFLLDCGNIIVHNQSPYFFIRIAQVAKILIPNSPLLLFLILPAT